MPAEPGLGSICSELQEQFGASLRAFPRSAEEVVSLAGTDLLVFVTDVDRRPVGTLDRETLQALNEHVERGGRLLLLGFATSLVHEMGVEPIAPDRFATYRWGVSNNTTTGRYRYGFHRVQDRMGGLLTKLEHVKQESQGWFLGGGEMVAAQSCHWETVEPQRGVVMGRLIRERDGELRRLDSGVLTYWKHGEGSVLAYGNLPEPWRGGDQVRANASQFLRNAVVSLCRGVPEDVVVLMHRDAATSAPSPHEMKPLPVLSQRTMPGAPLLPHWGWQLALHYQHENDRPVANDTVYNRVLLQSASAGADLLDLQIADSRRGYPLRWANDDPLPRPESYRSAVHWPEWTGSAIRELALACHRRGMLLHSYLEPGLAPGGTPGESMVASQWFAREFMDLRRLGEAALDGVGLRSWFGSDLGLAKTLALYQPSLLGYDVGPRRRRVPGFVRAVHADHGNPRGLHAAGLSRRWRNVFDPAEFPLAVLDCRSRLAPQPEWRFADADGGGSYGDWILTQANDFARQRIGMGAGMWWKAYNPRMMSPDTAAYVSGVSMLPIKAAVAGRLWATGAKGYRSLVSGFVDGVQSGFGAESPLPADTPFLSNNFVRVHGTDRPLQFDPTGRALFDASADLAKQRNFIRSTWSEMKFAMGEVDTRPIDFILGAPRGPQNYGPSVVISPEERGGESFPGHLSYDDPGRWPRRVELEFHADRANYTLHLALRGVSGRGIVELRCGESLLRVLAFREGDEPQRYRLNMPMAVGGERSFALQVVDGGTVAIEVCRLEHGGNVLLGKSVPTEVRIVEPAGPIAVLEERSGSSFLSESRRLSTIADLPGFVLDVKYEYLKPGLKVERAISLPGYHTLVSAERQVGQQVHGAIVLRHERAGHPDLMVVPIVKPRNHHLVVGERAQLTLVGRPSIKDRVAIGFLLLREPLSTEQARRILAAVVEPLTIRLDENGRCEVPPDEKVGTAYPRVVKLVHDRSTPFRVREGRHWYHRGCQPARDLGVWLHIYHPNSDPVDGLVQIESFDPITRPVVHPGPGSLRAMVLEAPEDLSVVAHLREVGPLLRAPSVVMPGAFNSVLLDGEPWAYFDGNRIFLPREKGTYHIEVRTKMDAAPKLRRASGSVSACAYEPRTGVLTITFADRGAGMAWVSGRPTAVAGGEILDDHQFGYPPRLQRQAAARGTMVRATSNELRLQYAPE